MEAKLTNMEVRLMKKKTLFVFLAFTVLALPLFGATKAALAKPITIKLGLCHLWPAPHRCSTDQFPRYIAMVEKAAKGKYKIKLAQYHPGMLIGGKEIFDGVTKGVVDMGSAALAYNPGVFPVMEALAQAGIAPPKSSDAAALATWEFYKKFKPKEFDGVKLLHMYATGPGWIHSKDPIRRIEDIEGMTIRATGNTARAIKALGGSPAAMTQAEVYLALQKGIARATIAPIEVLQGYKQAEVTEYSTFFPMGYTEQFYMIMNWDKWNSLPKDLQAAFDAVAEDAVREAGALWQYIQKEGGDYASSKHGHKFLYFSDEESARIIGRLKPIRDDYIKRVTDLGLPGEELANEAGRLMAKYNALTYKPYVP
jgi:TRAP-type C4-dicarboxylate transport system substrate-binding protein